MNSSLTHSIWTVAAMSAFIGIIIWAWSSKQKARFDDAANLPLDEDVLVTKTEQEASKHE